MNDIILFAISIVVMAALVLFRYVEVRRRKDLIPEAVRDASDRRILSFLRWLSRQQKRFWNFVLHVWKYIMHFISHAIVHSWEFLVKKSAKYINMVRGKGMLKTKASVSTFIKIKDELKQ